MKPISTHAIYQTAFVVLLLLTVGCRTTKPVLKTQGWIPVHSSELYYTVQGSGEPVLLVHAGFQDHRMWAQQIKALTTGGYRVITIDLPGHGRTKDGDSAYLIQDYLKVVMDSLRLQQASVVGLSLGGTSVTDFALAYPERVKKLVLAASVAVGYDKYHPIDTLTRQYVPAFFSAIRAKDYPQAARLFTRYWCDGIRDSADVDAAVRRYVYQTTLQSLNEHGWGKWAGFAEPPGYERLGSLQMPVLIIYGDKDLPMIQEAAGVLQQKIAKAMKREIKNAGHMLNMEEPAAFNKALLHFLKN